MLARSLKGPERDAHDGRDGRGMSISSLQRLGWQAIEAVVDAELDGLFSWRLSAWQPDTVLPDSHFQSAAADLPVALFGGDVDEDGGVGLEALADGVGRCTNQNTLRLPLRGLKRGLHEHPGVFDGGAIEVRG